MPAIQFRLSCFAVVPLAILFVSLYFYCVPAVFVRPILIRLRFNVFRRTFFFLPFYYKLIIDCDLHTLTHSHSHSRFHSRSIFLPFIPLFLHVPFQGRLLTKNELLQCGLTLMRVCPSRAIKEPLLEKNFNFFLSVFNVMKITVEKLEKVRNIFFNFYKNNYLRF